MGAVYRGLEPVEIADLDSPLPLGPAELLHGRLPNGMTYDYGVVALGGGEACWLQQMSPWRRAPCTLCRCTRCLNLRHLRPQLSTPHSCLSL